MSNENTRYNVLITSYLEPEHVDRLRDIDDRLEILYEPSLLIPPRYAADHRVFQGETGHWDYGGTDRCILSVLSPQ